MGDRGLAGTTRLLLACVLLVPGWAGAQHLFKCGSVYQDRPCAAEEVQQRYSHATGKFSVAQVNADTDKDCADAAGETIPYWKRMNSGESVDKLKAEIDARPVSRYEKSRMRDALLELRQFKGSASEVRGELERICMNHKWTKGIPTERDTNRAAQAQSDRAAAAQARAEQVRLRADEARAAAQERALQYEQVRAAAAARAAAVAERQGREQR